MNTGVRKEAERDEPIAWIIRLPNGWYRCKDNSTHKRRGHTGSFAAKRFPTRESALAECNEGETPVALYSEWGKTE